MNPINFAEYLGQAQQLVPDFAAETLRRQLGALQTQQVAAQTRATDAAARASDFQVQQGLVATERQRQFEEEAEAAIRSGDPRRLAGLIARFPQFGDQVKGAWDRLDSRIRDADLRDMGQVYAAANGGRFDIAAATLRRRIEADKAADGQADPSDEAVLGLLESGDPEQQKRGLGMIGVQLAAITGPEKFGSTYGTLNEGNSGFTLSPGAKRFDKDGKLIAEAPFAPRTVTVGEGQTVVEYDPNTGGGGPASGGVAGSRGDVSRLINTDAGGGYVPDNVRTLGQFVAFGRDLNRRGATSSSAGTYQINGSTMAEFGPKALGADWKNAPFNAETQDRVGREIFEWAKQQPNPAAALQGRWVALNRAEASRLVQGSWEQARGLIAQKESGGGAGASAGQAGGPRVIAQGQQKEGYRLLTPDEAAAAGLAPNNRYQQGPNGQITTVGGRGGAGGKVLRQPDADRLESQVSSVAALRDALSGFKDNFAGNTWTGEAENWLQSRFGTGTPGQRDWWAAFRATDNVLRNELFGATLTPPEKRSYEQTTISPEMTPSEIRRNLQTRVRIAQTALNRRIARLKAAGFNPDEIDAATGGVARPSVVTVRSVQEAQRLAPGTLYRAPDGKVRRR